MFTTLLEAAVRGGTLVAAAWVLLKALRLRDPAMEKNTWTLVVAAALVMPLLSWIAGIVAPPLRVVPIQLLPFSPVTSTAALTGTASGASGSHVALVCAYIYLGGMAALLMRLATGLWIGVRLRRSASTVSELHAGSADVRVSTAIRSPASFASTILLPVGYKSWDKSTLATVLAHEQAHIRNFDCYRLWLAALYRAVFWFDPLAHWLYWHLRELSELTSDEAAAAAGDRAAYAATLKQMASPHQLVTATIPMADSQSIGRRLRRLSRQKGLGPPLARAWRGLMMTAVLAVVVLAAVPWAGAEAPVAQRPATLEFHLVDDQTNPVHAHRSGEVPPGDKLYKKRDGTRVLLKRDAVATGDEIMHVVVRTTQQGTMVDIRLDARGADSMLRTTRENVGQEMAAVYNGEIINSAMIRGAFGGQFQITGLSAADAHSLAMLFGRAAK